LCNPIKRATRGQFRHNHDFTKENTDNCRKFHFITLTAKLNAISENLSFLLRACVQNEETGIHKFYQREIFFIGTFYVSFSYELCARKRLK